MKEQRMQSVQRVVPEADSTRLMMIPFVGVGVKECIVYSHAAIQNGVMLKRHAVLECYTFSGDPQISARPLTVGEFTRKVVPVVQTVRTEAQSQPGCDFNAQTISIAAVRVLPGIVGIGIISLVPQPMHFAVVLGAFVSFFADTDTDNQMKALVRYKTWVDKIAGADTGMVKRVRKVLDQGKCPPQKKHTAHGKKP